MRPSRPLIVGTASVLALGVWLSRGSIGVADAAAWPRRFGLLPSWWVPFVACAVLFVALFRARRVALLPLLFPLVLLLPWLPFPVPAAALIWTGRVVAWVWIATAVATAVAIHTHATTRPVQVSAAAGTGNGSHGSKSTSGNSNGRSATRRARKSTTKRTAQATKGTHQDGSRPNRRGQAAASATPIDPRESHTPSARTDAVPTMRGRDGRMNAACYHMWPCAERVCARG